MPTNSSNKKRNYQSLIKVLYYYGFAALGLVLLIIGIFHTSQYIVKKAFLPKYHLGFEENRCDYTRMEPAAVKSDQPEQNIQTKEDEQKRCLVNLEEFRKFKEVTDIAGSLTLIVLGAILFGFHFKKSRETV